MESGHRQMPLLCTLALHGAGAEREVATHWECHIYLLHRWSDVAHGKPPMCSGTSSATGVLGTAPGP